MEKEDIFSKLDNQRQNQKKPHKRVSRNRSRSETKLQDTQDIKPSLDQIMTFFNNSIENNIFTTLDMQSLRKLETKIKESKQNYGKYLDLLERLEKSKNEKKNTISGREETSERRIYEKRIIKPKGLGNEMYERSIMQSTESVTTQHIYLRLEKARRSLSKESKRWGGNNSPSFRKINFERKADGRDSRYRSRKKHQKEKKKLKKMLKNLKKEVMGTIKKHQPSIPKENISGKKLFHETEFEETFRGKENTSRDSRRIFRGEILDNFSVLRSVEKKKNFPVNREDYDTRTLLKKVRNVINPKRNNSPSFEKNQNLTQRKSRMIEQKESKNSIDELKTWMKRTKKRKIMRNSERKKFETIQEEEEIKIVENIKSPEKQEYSELDTSGDEDLRELTLTENQSFIFNHTNNIGTTIGQIEKIQDKLNKLKSMVETDEKIKKDKNVENYQCETVDKGIEMSQEMEGKNGRERVKRVIKFDEKTQTTFDGRKRGKEFSQSENYRGKYYDSLEEKSRNTLKTAKARVGGLVKEEKNIKRVFLDPKIQTKKEKRNFEHFEGENDGIADYSLDNDIKKEEIFDSIKHQSLNKNSEGFSSKGRRSSKESVLVPHNLPKSHHRSSKHGRRSVASRENSVEENEQKALINEENLENIFTLTDYEETFMSMKETIQGLKQDVPKDRRSKILKIQKLEKLAKKFEEYLDKGAFGVEFDIVEDSSHMRLGDSRRRKDITRKCRERSKSYSCSGSLKKYRKESKYDILVKGKKRKLSKKQMREITRKNWNKLPEVRKKKKKELEKRWKENKRELVKDYDNV